MPIKNCNFTKNGANKIGGAKIYFKQPFIDMIEPRYKQFRDDTFQTVFYTPQPGMILIFRSYLEHCVEKHDSDSERITLSYNFRKK